jgi:hypothetical protein
VMVWFGFLKEKNDPPCRRILTGGSHLYVEKWPRGQYSTGVTYFRYTGLIWRITPFIRLLRHTRGFGGSILTRILTGPVLLWRSWGNKTEYRENLIVWFTGIPPFTNNQDVKRRDRSNSIWIEYVPLYCSY